LKAQAYTEGCNEIKLSARSVTLVEIDNNY